MKQRAAQSIDFDEVDCDTSAVAQTKNRGILRTEGKTNPSRHLAVIGVTRWMVYARFQTLPNLRTFQLRRTQATAIRAANHRRCFSRRVGRGGVSVSATSTQAVRRAFQAEAFKFWFGVERGPAMLLVELLKARGDFVSIADLSVRCAVSMASVKYRISELRSAMVSESVDTRSGAYALTTIGIEECRMAFNAMRPDLELVA